MTVMLTTPAQIAAYQLSALKHAVRLEGLGLRRRGTSATSQARTLLGLGRGATRQQILDQLQQRLDQKVAEIQ